MTEEEWLKCIEPDKMLGYYWKKGSDRKYRLFASACCRHIWHLLTDDRSRLAVDVAERYADGNATKEELDAVSTVAYSACSALVGNASLAAQAAFETMWENNSSGALPVGNVTYCIFCAVDKNAAEHLIQSILLRDIFGPLPFRSVTLDPKCLTPTIKQLAEVIYQERQFDRLGILADALEEAGCTEQEVLQHLRSNGEHVRGCFALDLVLGRS